ncbi:MAG: glycosyltransferase family 4 protein [Pseudomonadota bacterium]
MASDKRRILAAFLYLSCISASKTQFHAQTRAFRAMLQGPKESRSGQLLQRRALARISGLPQEVSYKRLFRRWVDAGIPGNPMGILAGGTSEQPDEDAFKDFVLNRAWTGELATSDDAEKGPTTSASFQEVHGLLAQIGEPEVPQQVLNGNPQATAEIIADMKRLNAAGYATNITSMVAHQTLYPGEAMAMVAERGRRAKELKQRLTTGAMAALVRKAAQFEPLVAHPARGPNSYVIPPNPNVALTASLKRLYDELERRPAKHVVVTNRCGMSGAARVAATASHAFATLEPDTSPDDIVVIRTEHSDLEYPQWFPEGVRHLDFPGLILSSAQPERKKLLLAVLRGLAPQTILNVNSRLLWDITLAHGKVFSDQSRFFAYFFCSDMRADGYEAGYPVEFFYRAMGEVNGFITDSDDLADTLRSRYMLPDNAPGLHVLRTPLLDPVPPVQRAPSDADATTTARPKILWAGRFDRQKRVDLLVEIARTMPDVDFLVWGKAVLDAGRDPMPSLPNLIRKGTYSDFAELPLSEAHAWLYTSAWDGVPTLLMDVAAAGVPLVGSLVGGTGEVMHDGLAVGLKPDASAKDYVTAIRQVIADQEGAWARAAILADRIRDERNLTRYREDLRDILAQKDGN